MCAAAYSFAPVIIAGIRLARERQVNVRLVPTGKAIEESVDLAHEIYNRVFRKVTGRLENSGNLQWLLYIDAKLANSTRCR